MKAALALTLTLITVQAQAAWISVCQGAVPPQSAHVLAEAMRPSGELRWLVISTVRLATCESSELALNENQILTGRFVSARLIADSGKGIVLRGRVVKSKFAISEISVVASVPEDAEAAIAGIELLSLVETTVFGAEQRAAVRRTGANLIVDCASGALPAGLVLRLPSRGLPLGAPLTAVLDYAGTGTFELGIVDTARAARGDPLIFATLTGAGSRATLAVPANRIELATAQSWTLVCPAHAARLELRSFRIETAADKEPPPRALWAWQPAEWLDTPAILIDRLAAARARTLFMTVPVDLADARVSNVRELQAFISSATARGIRVWAVAGDPQAVLPAGRVSFAVRAAAFARYNRDSPAASRLAGVQYDVEPYLNPGYTLDPTAWHEAYLEMLRILRREGGDLKLDIAVPFWWSAARVLNGRLLDALASVVDSITVMNYRTEPTAIMTSAQPFLEWGVRARRQVRIALEAGPIPDEEDRMYTPDSHGEVVLREEGGGSWLLLCDSPVSIAGARAFRFSHKTRMVSANITFHDHREKLRVLAQELEWQWSAWPAFAGVALHEY